MMNDGVNLFVRERDGREVEDGPSSNSVEAACQELRPFPAAAAYMGEAVAHMLDHTRPLCPDPFLYPPSLCFLQLCSPASASRRQAVGTSASTILPLLTAILN